MTIDETDTVLTLWVGLIEKSWLATRPGDFLALLVTTQEKQLKAEYRFRWSAGAGFDAGDEISRYVVDPQPDTEENREKISNAFRVITTNMLTESQEVPVNGDARKLQAAMLELKNWQVRMEAL